MWETRAKNARRIKLMSTLADWAQSAYDLLELSKMLVGSFMDWVNPFRRQTHIIETADNTDTEEPTSEAPAVTDIGTFFVDMFSMMDLYFEDEIIICQSSVPFIESPPRLRSAREAELARNATRVMVFNEDEGPINSEVELIDREGCAAFRIQLMENHACPESIHLRMVVPVDGALRRLISQRMPISGRVIKLAL